MIPKIFNWKKFLFWRMFNLCQKCVKTERELIVSKIQSFFFSLATVVVQFPLIIVSAMRETDRQTERERDTELGINTSRYVPILLFSKTHEYKSFLWAATELWSVGFSNLTLDPCHEQWTQHIPKPLKVFLLFLTADHSVSYICKERSTPKLPAILSHARNFFKTLPKSDCGIKVYPFMFKMAWIK